MIMKRETDNLFLLQASKFGLKDMKKFENEAGGFLQAFRGGLL